MSRALSSFKPSIGASLAGFAAAAFLIVFAAAANAAAPPGRAYEKVTPAGKGGGDLLNAWDAKPSGGGVSYTGFSAFDDAGGGVALVSEYSSVRGPSGWSLIDRNPVLFGPASLFGVLIVQQMTEDY